jgi:hypothetical protein
MSDKDYEPPLPPATFDFLIASLSMQAQVQLGALHFGKPEERPEPNLPLARHSIDMLGMLQEKTRGNLTLEEQRELENSLTELRFRYVQAVEQQAKAKAETEKTGNSAETATP